MSCQTGSCQQRTLFATTCRRFGQTKSDMPWNEDQKALWNCIRESHGVESVRKILQHIDVGAEFIPEIMPMAVARCDPEVVEFLLQYPGVRADQFVDGLLCNLLKSHSRPANMMAMLQTLLRLGADPNCRDAISGMLNTPLILAASTSKHATSKHGVKNDEIVQLLLESGADISLSNRDGDTPMHAATNFERIRFCLPNINVLSSLVAHSAASIENLLVQRNQKDQTPLDCLIWPGPMDEKWHDSVALCRLYLLNAYARGMQNDRDALEKLFPHTSLHREGCTTQIETPIGRVGVDEFIFLIERIQVHTIASHSHTWKLARSQGFPEEVVRAVQQGPVMYYHRYPDTTAFIYGIYAHLLAKRYGLQCLHVFLHRKGKYESNSTTVHAPISSVGTQTLLYYLTVHSPKSVITRDKNGRLPLQVASEVLHLGAELLYILLRNSPDTLSTICHESSHE